MSHGCTFDPSMRTPRTIFILNGVLICRVMKREERRQQFLLHARDNGQVRRSGFPLDSPTLSVCLSVGSFFSTLFSRLWGDKELRILILGLDGAGKTTILYRMQIGEVVTTIPSEFSCASVSVPGYNTTLRKAIGFNVETVTYKNLKFQVWDLG